MKTAIVYFSQTGNTRKVAGAIAEGIKEKTGQCDLLRMIRASDIDVASLNKYDLIGLGCPTFGYQEPFHIELFIRRFSGLAGKHAFVFTTSGGHPGNTLPSMADKLAARGLVVVGGFSCDARTITPIDLPSPWFTDSHPDEQDLKDSASFGREVVERSAQIVRGRTELIPQFQWLNDEFYYYRRGAVIPRSTGFDGDLRLDRDKCRYPKCRLCMNNCPVGAVDLSVEPLKFRKGCISCYFCEAICPTAAIHFEPRSQDERAAAKGHRFYVEYHYVEFFAEAKARLVGNRSTFYRPFIDPVRLVEPGSPYYKLNPKRPRTKLVP